jgi:tRNA-specific adenosine deaminase 1
VVALATGTKCLGPSRMSEHGWVIHDCHAEVLCRRTLIHAILTWLENEEGESKESLDWLLERDSSFIHGSNDTTSKTRVRLKPGVQLHLYISDSPCGDGALVGEYTPRKEGEPLEQPPGCLKKQQVDKNDCLGEQKGPENGSDVQDEGVFAETPEPKRARVGRITGAKPAAAYREVNTESSHPNDDACVGAASQPIVGSTEHENKHDQSVGALRTKSGRSDLREQDRTMCMSCSDKILLWNMIGMQGALLAETMEEPVMLRSVIIGADALWPDLQSSHVCDVVSRAVFGRAAAAAAAASSTNSMW